jgi:hypothetical protein
MHAQTNTSEIQKHFYKVRAIFDPIDNQIFYQLLLYLSNFAMNKILSKINIEEIQSRVTPLVWLVYISGLIGCLSLIPSFALVIAFLATDAWWLGYLSTAFLFFSFLLVLICFFFAMVVKLVDANNRYV